MPFISKLEEYEVPKEPRGRYHRMVIDIDMDAVRDYVFTGDGERGEWPVMLVEEMVTVVREMARRESMMSLMAKR